MIESSLLFNTVIFDLDGTITDSAPGILASLNHAFSITGYPAPANLRRFIGPPFETAFRAEGFCVNEITNLLECYREHYWSIGAFQNSLYPGIQSLLDDLRQTGLRIAICTSCLEPTARMIIDHFGLTERFEVIGGATLNSTRLTKGEVLRHVLDRLGSTRPVMVGDRAHDVEAALAENIDCIGVRWGYAAVIDELERAGARWVVEYPEEILYCCRLHL